jgi:methyl-accepting chemotaxis protein
VQRGRRKRTSRTLLARVKLSIPIGTLAGLGIAGLLAISGFFFYYDKVTTTALAQAGRAGEIYDKVGLFDRALLLAKKAEKNFLATGLLAEADSQSAAMLVAQSALQDVENAADDGGEDPALKDIASHITDFRAAANGYNNAFTAIVELSEEVGVDDSMGFQAKLKRTVDDAEALLKGVADPAVRIAMLLLQRDERDFLLRLSPATRDIFQQDFDTFTAALAAAGLDAGRAAAITAGMAEFSGAFLALVPKRLALAQDSVEIANVYTELEPKLRDWEDQVLTLRDSAVDALADTRAKLRRLAMWVAGGVLLGMVVFAGLIGFGLTRALRRIVDVMGRLARDDRDFDLAHLCGNGEIGRMAASLEVFRTTAVAAERLHAEADAARVAAEDDKRRAMAAMVETIEHQATIAMNAVAAITTQMDGTAQTMATSADRTLGLADESGEAADRAMATAQTVASAAEQLTASIGEITRQVTHSSAVSRQAVHAALGARDVIALLVVQARRIGEVAGLITDVAARTNLLALNATIEAARAGDAGRGFAVVAGEVKSLALQTTRATQDIARELTAITSATENAVQAIRLIETTIGEVDSIGGAIAASVEQQGLATAEIARAVGETAAAAAIVSASVAEVTREAAATGEQTSRVRADSATLIDSVRDLKTAIVRAVRTADDDIDRRRSERFAVDLPCRIETADGQIIEAVVADISSGGMTIRGVAGTVEGVVRVEIRGVSFASEKVSRGANDLLRVKLSLDDGERAALDALLRQLFPSALIDAA